MNLGYVHGFIIILFLCSSVNAQNSDGARFWKQPENHSLLLLTQTAGWHHDSLVVAEEKFTEMAETQNWLLTKANNLDNYFQSVVTLRRFSVIVFLLTSGPIFSEVHQASFKQFVDEGGAVVGVHSAADTNKHWPWFLQLIGAEFVGHPNIQNATMITETTTHPSTSFLPPTWQLTEEYYNFAKPLKFDDKKILLRVDENSYQGGIHGNPHPISWTKTHQPAGSRIWYTALGHTPQGYTGSAPWNMWFRAHLVAGVQWAANGTVEARARWQEFKKDIL